MDFKLIEALKYLKKKKIPVIEKTLYLDNGKREHSFLIGNIIKKGKFYMIQDTKGTHIIASNMIETIKELKMVRIIVNN
jgi:hypothetical protein